MRRRARREAIILGVLAEGKSGAAVAREMGISRQAVAKVVGGYRLAMRGTEMAKVPNGQMAKFGRERRCVMAEEVRRLGAEVVERYLSLLARVYWCDADGGGLHVVLDDQNVAIDSLRSAKPETDDEREMLTLLMSLPLEDRWWLVCGGLASERERDERMAREGIDPGEARADWESWRGSGE